MGLAERVAFQGRLQEGRGQMSHEVTWQNNIPDSPTRVTAPASRSLLCGGAGWGYSEGQGGTEPEGPQQITESLANC
jgi:hypothetical protein